jgi:hypothetical protein
VLNLVTRLSKQEACLGRRLEVGIALDEIEPVAIEMLAWWKSAKAKGRQTVRKSRHMSIHQTLHRSAAARKQLRSAEGADVH